MLNVEGVEGRASSGRVKISIEVGKGAIGIWPAKLGEASTHLADRVVIDKGPLSVVEIPLVDVSVPFTLMFSNGSNSGVSEATIVSISVVGP